MGKRTHTVQAGESLWTISKTYYGSGDYHARISEANRLKNNTIRAGQVLVIPAPPSGVAMREPISMPAAELVVETSDEKNTDTLAEIVDVSTENEDSKSGTSHSAQMAPSLSVKIPINKE
jgi:LysM repeat protein